MTEWILGKIPKKDVKTYLYLEHTSDKRVFRNLYGSRGGDVTEMKRGK
jgi:hypothetical protein